MLCMQLKENWECTVHLGGGRPTCEETQQRILNETMNRGNVSMCTANDVPSTYSYFQVCTSALCIPQVFCEDPEW